MGKPGTRCRGAQDKTIQTTYPSPRQQLDIGWDEGPNGIKFYTPSVSTSLEAS